MKCQVTSSSTHDVLISREISYKSYTEICSGEKTKVNLGLWGNWWNMKVENNSLVTIKKDKGYYYIPGQDSSNMALDGEVLSKFFSIHNIEQNWLHCNYTYGYYDDELGGWTGCVGKV